MRQRKPLWSDMQPFDVRHPLLAPRLEHNTIVVNHDPVNDPIRYDTIRYGRLTVTVHWSEGSLVRSALKGRRDGQLNLA